MSDILKIIDELTDRLFAKYGNPLATYKKTHHDIHMTYYVGKLMEERGHEHIFPEDKDSAYYSETALQDAFLAGQLLAKKDTRELRKIIVEELEAELHEAIDDL